MESFAFWYKERAQEADEQEGSRKLAASVHFNLWCECGWEKGKNGLPTTASRYLDIGFRVEGLSRAQALFFFLPFPIRREQKNNDIEDLGRKFLENALLADALFNDSHNVTVRANRKEIDVYCLRTSELFKIYQLDVVNDISLEPFGEGTILEIKTDRIISNMEQNEGEYDYYFRFRIKNQSLDFLIHQYNPPFGVIQGLFNITYMIDFRYHNIRGLDNTLVERFHEKRNHPVPVKQLNFFLMTKAYVDVSNTNFKVRKLEQNVWKDYVDGLDTRDLVAYHYKDKPNKNKCGTVQPGESDEERYIDSSELFAKFRVEKAVTGWYLLLTVLVGVMGSLIGSAIWEFGLKSFLTALLF